ncbi:diguanylate cyclase domain-containing protein, partial [Piscinibacter sp.]|uniref:diguanylate cyclase domain-containing protein n=1 Tax=Piscinibacter sp. TaxID=1903157 RepID=UPI003783A600
MDNTLQARYLIETPLDPAQVAEVLAGEQSSGTFVRVAGESDELRARSRDDETFAVLLLGLDRFKHVNDVLGWPLGDQLLQVVAQRLARACGDDGCGVSCGSCGAGELCNASRQCECVPRCDGKNCGSNGCG